MRDLARLALTARHARIEAAAFYRKPTPQEFALDVVRCFTR